MALGHIKTSPRHEHPRDISQKW